MADPSKKFAGQVDRFDDLLHDYGDDADEHEDADVDFDQFFTTFDRNDDEQEQLAEEQHLSQKLSQLSASNAEPSTVKKRPAITPTTPPKVTLKKLRTEVGDYSDLPKYLSSDETILEEAMGPLLQRSGANPLTMEDLREMAFLEHRLAVATLETSIWRTYLRSGTGKLQETEEQAAVLETIRRLAIWPKRLETIIRADPNVKLESGVVDRDLFHNYTNKMLENLQDQTTSCQTRLAARRKRFANRLTREMDDAIKKMVEEHGIVLHRILTESQIAVVNFDFNDRSFVLDFHEAGPYADQLKVFNDLSQSKLDAEVAKMEVKLLKQRVAHQQLASVFETFRVPPPSALETIQDAGVQQRLTHRYEQLLERTKSEMMILHIRTAEVKTEEYQKQFDADLKNFYQQQRTGPSDEKFSATLLRAMEGRFKNIDQRLETLYNLKVRFFVKAPTVNKN